MPSKNKTELLSVTQTEFSKLEKLLEQIEPNMAQTKQDDISIKDIIAHRAHWIGLFLNWYADGLAGKEVFFPAKGYKWNQLKKYNADLRERQHDIDWNSAKRRLAKQNKVLIDFIDGHTDEELYGAPMKGTNNDWPPGRWAEAAGPSHYRSAAKYIRSRLRSRSTTS